MDSELIPLTIAAIKSKIIETNSKFETLERCHDLVHKEEREECEKCFKQVLEHLLSVLGAYECLKDSIEVDTFKQLNDWYANDFTKEYYYALNIFNSYL